MQEQNTTTAELEPINGLHNQFASFEIPNEIKEMHKKGIRPFGSLNKVKFGLFMKDQVFNDIYNSYLVFPPQKQKDEVHEEYKNRMKFQKVLHKYKPEFFDYSVYPKRNKHWEKKNDFVKEMFDLETI